LTIKALRLRDLIKGEITSKVDGIYYSKEMKIQNCIWVFKSEKDFNRTFKVKYLLEFKSRLLSVTIMEYTFEFKNDWEIHRGYQFVFMKILSPETEANWGLCLKINSRRLYGINQPGIMKKRGRIDPFRKTSHDSSVSQKNENIDSPSPPPNEVRRRPPILSDSSHSQSVENTTPSPSNDKDSLKDDQTGKKT
jgi:hypothetical protein